MNYKVKIITKYRGANNVEYSIPAQETHKAYYLFFNPEQRGVFNDGLALKGEDIDRIVPDYNGTMGWNPTHVIGDDDWNELKSKGVDQKLQNILIKARDVARLNNPHIELPLTEAVKVLPAISDDIKKLANKMKA